MPALVIGLIVVAAFMLMAMPFGRDPGPTSTAAVDTADQTESIVQVVTDAPPPVAALPPNVAPDVSSPGVPPPAVTNTLPMVPPATTGTMPVPTNTLPVQTTTPPAPTNTLPAPTSAAPSQSQPPPQELPRNDSGELTAAAATARLVGYIRGTNYYNTDPECVRAVNQGYKNEGYTLEVWGDCGQERRLGRWRVDAKNGDVFRQREDGRYLDP